MPKLAHHVFFTLKERNEKAVQQLLKEAKTYLHGQDGVVDFALGVRDRELDRPVNGDFDVSLHVVFADRAAHDAYQVCQPHQTFIANNKDSWEKVQVFDSTLVMVDL